jgi:hypothetical protein
VFFNSKFYHSGPLTKRYFNGEASIHFEMITGALQYVSQADLGDVLSGC